MGKGENAGYQHFLLFPQSFQKASFSGSLKVRIVWERVKYIFHVSVKIPKLTPTPVNQDLMAMATRPTFYLTTWHSYLDNVEQDQNVLWSWPLAIWNSVKCNKQNSYDQNGFEGFLISFLGYLKFCAVLWWEWFWRLFDLGSLLSEILWTVTFKMALEAFQSRL